MYASRNITLCNKDCVCLFVCPTGATDTETGQIDREACIDGCRLCVDACPSHAIYLVMEKYANPQTKAPDLSETLMEFCDRKRQEEVMALAHAAGSMEAGAGRLARAIAHSARILAEDCAREAGYMTPQGAPTRTLLTELATSGDTRAKPIIEQIVSRQAD